MSYSHTLSLGLALSTAIIPSVRADGDAGHGKALFTSLCAGCHTATAKNNVGPGLAGVFGRQAGTVPGFRYSKSMVAFGKLWNDETLATYLAAPAKTVPGTSMLISVASASNRADIIAYLKQISQ